MKLDLYTPTVGAPSSAIATTFGGLRDPRLIYLQPKAIPRTRPPCSAPLISSCSAHRSLGFRRPRGNLMAYRFRGARPRVGVRFIAIGGLRISRCWVFWIRRYVPSNLYDPSRWIVTASFVGEDSCRVLYKRFESPGCMDYIHKECSLIGCSQITTPHEAFEASGTYMRHRRTLVTLANPNRYSREIPKDPVPWTPAI